MKSRQSLILAVLPGSALVAAELCGTVGISTALPYYTTTSPALYNAAACGEHCAQDTECHTYALGLGMCLHFASPSSSIFEESSSSPWTLYDRGCPPSDAHRSQLVPADAPCLIDPNSTESQFRLLGPDFVPLVATRNKQLRPSLGGDERVSTFLFQKAASAPAGLYDIVLAGPEPQYVAKAADGQMVLTSASTGLAVQNVNRTTLVTSIFTLDCDGRVGVMHDGVHYNWTVSSDGRIASFNAESRLANSTMVAFDMEKFGGSRKHHELRRSLVRRGDFLVKRNNPRCPARQRAVEKPNVQTFISNGCGSGATAALTPELSFRECCAGHDACFRDCNVPTCKECNNSFYSCMKSTCSGNIFKKGFCRVAAKTYYEAVELLGCSKFDGHTRERCDCVQG